jgi:putative flippase GtrA
MIGSVIRFCVVGSLVAVIDFSCLWLFKQFLPRMAAVSASYFIAVATHFCLNKWWVFGSRQEAQVAEVARYLTMVFCCWLCTISVVWLSLRFITQNLFVARALAMPIATVVSFLGMRLFVFRGHSSPGPEEKKSAADSVE